jgi:hypothetical protein
LRPTVRERRDRSSARRAGRRYCGGFSTTRLRPRRPRSSGQRVARFGALPVVASGGCFQNARLAESIQAGARARAPVLFPREVPPGDGGIALGQAIVADVLARR